MVLPSPVPQLMDRVAINAFALHLANFRIKVDMLASLKVIETPPANSMIVIVASAAARLASAARKAQARHVTPHYTRLMDSCNQLHVIIASFAEEYQRESSSDEKKIEIMNDLLKECAVFEDNLTRMEGKKLGGDLKLERDLKRVRLEARCPYYLLRRDLRSSVGFVVLFSAVILVILWWRRAGLEWCTCSPSIPGE